MNASTGRDPVGVRLHGLAKPHVLVQAGLSSRLNAWCSMLKHGEGAGGCSVAVSNEIPPTAKMQIGIEAAVLYSGSSL